MSFIDVKIIMLSISEKLKSLRKNRKLSQQHVADAMNVSRVAYSQIELWERKVSAEELHRAADFFETDINAFFVQEEISVPAPSEDPHYAIKQVILYLSNKLADKKNYGETLLNKLLYFVDFDYYEWTGELVTGETYLKQPYGPVPAHITQILDEMEHTWLIARTSATFHWYPQKKIKAIADPDMSVFDRIDVQMKLPLENYTVYSDLPQVEEMMELVIAKYGSWTASAVSERSHRDAPWRAAENIGDKLDPSLVFYREDSFVVNHHNLEDEDDD